MGIRREEEMEMSEDDCEESPCKRMRTGESTSSLMNLIIVLLTVAVATVCAAADVYEQTLKEENDSLRWQLDSYRNEVELLRKEQMRNSRGDDEQALGQTNGPDVHIQLLQQSLHGVQQVGPSSLRINKVNQNKL